jgi:hypothetical protein
MSILFGHINLLTCDDFFHTPSDLVVEGFNCSLISSRSEDLQIKQPVVCR